MALSEFRIHKPVVLKYSLENSLYGVTIYMYKPVVLKYPNSEFSLFCLKMRTDSYNSTKIGVRCRDIIPNHTPQQENALKIIPLFMRKIHFLGLL